MGVICFIAGAFLSSMGFYLWYVRLQKFEDIAARNRTKQVRLK